MAEPFVLTRKKVEEDRTFKFQVAGEDLVYEVPIIDALPMKFLAEIQSAATKANSGNRRKKSEGQSELLNAFLHVLDEYAPGLTEEITAEDLEALLEAWTNAGETSLGE